MTSRMTAKQSVQMLEDGTNQQWRVIPESQTRYYPHAGQANAFFVLCLDNSCNGKIYVVPKLLKPHYSDYDRLLKFLRKKGLPILPKINVNLTNFPAQPYAVIFGGFSLEGDIKPVGSLSLKSLHSANPLTYTPGKLANIKYTHSRQINNYLNAWNKVSLNKRKSDGELSLKVSNSITNESYDFDVALEGNVFSVTITLTPSHAVLGNEWVIEGQIALKITGVMVDTGSISPSRTNQSVTRSHHAPLEHNAFYMIGIGVGAFGLGAITLFSGGLDAPLVAAIAVASA